MFFVKPDRIIRTIDTSSVPRLFYLMFPALEVTVVSNPGLGSKWQIIEILGPVQRIWGTRCTSFINNSRIRSVRYKIHDFCFVWFVCCSFVFQGRKCLVRKISLLFVFRRIQSPLFTIRLFLLCPLFLVSYFCHPILTWSFWRECCWTSFPPSVGVSTDSFLVWYFSFVYVSRTPR